MKNLEDAESKLVLDVKNNDEFEIYKLNSMTIIAFLKEDKKKLTSERDLFLKKYKNL